MMWFSQPYIAKTLHDGMVVKVSGRVAGTGAKVYLANPTIDKSPVAPDAVHDSLFRQGGVLGNRVVSHLSRESGVSSLWLMHAIRKVFETNAHEHIEDPIPSEILARYKLPSLSSAFVFIHAPKKLSDATVARKRFAFEEVFALQIVMQQRRQTLLSEKALPVAVNREALTDFIASFPFPATKAQMRAIDAIVADFEKPHPMLRLLEGDVGSGKTAVAAATAYLVATSLPKGRIAGTLQVAYLCPHRDTREAAFLDFCFPTSATTPSLSDSLWGVSVASSPQKVRYEESTKLSRAAFKKMAANGEIPIVIGTHALVEKSLSFKYFAYAIIDEQHRFGTSHRQKLATKNDIVPHLLSMTATPIPRTLALTLYGDLDLTLLDEMPIGRKSVITEVLARRNERKHMNACAPSSPSVTKHMSSARALTCLRRQASQTIIRLHLKPSRLKPKRHVSRNQSSREQTSVFSTAR